MTATAIPCPDKRELRIAEGTAPRAGIHSVGFGFLPAFRDLLTGETHLSTNTDGTLAPIHLLDGIPDVWVKERDAQGRVIALRESVIAGYLRGERFFTHRQVQTEILDA